MKTLSEGRNSMKKLFLFTKDESDTKVANDRLFSHAVGLAGQNIAYNFVSSRLFVFLNTVLGIPAEKTGIVTGLSTTWDAINDPLIGSFVDNRRHKPGRKMKPFLIYFPPIIGLLIAMMFFDFGLNETQTIICVAVLYLLFDTFYSFEDVAIWGVSAMTTPSSQERKRVTQWISIGAGAGGTIAGLFPMIKQIIVDSGKMTEKNVYLLFGIIFGFGGMLISMLAARQKEKVSVPKEDSKINIWKSLSNLRYNRTLIIICIARIVQSFSLTLAWEYFFESEGIAYNFFGTEVTGGTAQIFYGYIMGIPGALVGFFTVPMINRLGGSKKTLVYAELANTVTRLIAFAIGSGDRYKNTGTILAVMAIIGSAQILTNMKGIAERSLLTDSVDEMELLTGERTEGITFSMQNFVSKLTGAIPKFIQGYMLKFMGFNEKLGTGGSDTIAKQIAPRFLKYRWHQFILGPVIGSVLYLIAIAFLKDDREYTAEVERKLKEKRALAEVAEGA